MDVRSLFMGLAFALMWASAFTSTRMVVLDAAPLHALALRFLVAGALGVGIAWAMGQRATLTRAQWKATIAFGVLQNVIYLGCNFTAMQWVEASVAAIIGSTMPLIVAVTGWVFMGERMRPLGIFGLFAGFLGVAVIMGSRISGGIDMAGLVLCILGVIALASAALAVRGASGGGNLLMVVGLQMLVGAVFLVPAALLFEPFRFDPNPRLALAFVYTLLVPGLLATWVWFMLVGRIGAVRAATFHFLNPFFGLVIAAVLLNERIGALDVVGVVIAAGGILAVQLSKARA